MSAATNCTNRRLDLDEALSLKAGTFATTLSARAALFLRARAFDMGITPDELASDLLAATLIPDDYERRRLDHGDQRAPGQ